VSAGGESFIVYQMDAKGKVSRISSGNKCASGTGEFFMQQIRRMNVGVEDAVRLAKSSTNPHKLSGRCSVFCKSDCTHALNKGEPIADVAAGLARMIAKKIEELLVKIGARGLVVGGTARNGAVIDFLKEQVERWIPRRPLLRGPGPALWALDSSGPRRGKRRLLQEVKSSFEFLSPFGYADKVDSSPCPRAWPRPGTRCVVGLDVGSTTTKAVLFRLSDEKISAPST
jgi:activator of 2-hydroxyglutaryl-CoA dehydratase